MLYRRVSRRPCHPTPPRFDRFVDSSSNRDIGSSAPSLYTAPPGLLAWQGEAHGCERNRIAMQADHRDCPPPSSNLVSSASDREREGTRPLISSRGQGSPLHSGHSRGGRGQTREGGSTFGDFPLDGDKTRSCPSGTQRAILALAASTERHRLTAGELFRKETREGVWAFFFCPPPLVSLPTPVDSRHKFSKPHGAPSFPPLPLLSCRLDTPTPSSTPPLRLSPPS